MPPSKKAEPPRLFAFWRYDLFPYVLGAEVVSMDDDGCVRVVGYGPGGGLVAPFRLVPVEAGRKLFVAIQQLKHEHEGAKKAFDAEWRAKLEAIFPGLMRPAKKEGT